MPDDPDVRRDDELIDRVVRGEALNDDALTRALVAWRWEARARQRRTVIRRRLICAVAALVLAGVITRAWRVALR